VVGIMVPFLLQFNANYSLPFFRITDFKRIWMITRMIHNLNDLVNRKIWEFGNLGI